MNNTPPEPKPLAVETVTSIVVLREELKHSALIGVLWSRKMPHTLRKVNEILHLIKPRALRKP